MSITNLEEKVNRLRREVKKIMDVLELSPTVDPLDWKDFTELDKGIIKHLLEKKYAGDTTTGIAEAIGLDKPTSTGRVIVWRRLKRIQRISNRIKGAPIVLIDKKRWFMNYDEFTYKE